MAPLKHPCALPEGPVRRPARAPANVAVPFTGLTTDGHAVPGLNTLWKTGMSVQPIVAATDAFLGALTPDEQVTASFEVDRVEWRTWSNIYPSSTAGYGTARDGMKFNEHIREVTGRDAESGEWYDRMSVLVMPSTPAPWGWQIDGCHRPVNCLVLGDSLVMTPTLMDSEPVTSTFGNYAGTCVLHAEEATGVALMQALTPAQQQRAEIGMGLPGDAFGGLSSGQRRLRVSLIETFVGRIRPGHAEIRLEDVQPHLPDTSFAWIGPCDGVSPFDDRIDSPVILLAFDYQSGIALDNDAPSRRQIHTVVRTPNG